MTVEEIKAKHQPRQLENQVEFDAIMSDINQQLSALSAEYQDIEAKAKAINRPLHDLKHEWITLNPRERFIKPKEENV